MKDYKPLLVNLLLGITLVFIIMPLGGYGGHPIKFFFAAIAYCIVSVWRLAPTVSARDKFIVLVLLLIPPTLTYVPVTVSLWPSTKLSLPSTLAHYLGAMVGLLIHLSRRKLIRFTLAALLLFISAWVWHTGYHLYLHKLNYGSFSGSVEEKIQGFNLSTADGSALTQDDFKDKTVLFDFWNTGCGICFKKFPLIQQQYEIHMNNPKVEVYGVNIPFRGDSVGQAEQLFARFGHSFPTLFANDQNLAEIFKVKVYPTVIILQDGQDILYRGSIEQATGVMEKYL